MKKRQYSPEPATSSNNVENKSKKQQKNDNKQKETIPITTTATTSTTTTTTNTTTIKETTVIEKEIEEEGDLLKQLSDILKEMKTTTSTGEISAELLGQLKMLLLHIEKLAADDDNIEARELKDETDKYLELWFAEIVAQCEADGEIDWEDFKYESSSTPSSPYDSNIGSGNNSLHSSGDNHIHKEEDDSSDEEDNIALALALQDEEDAVDDNDNDNDYDDDDLVHDHSNTKFKVIELNDESLLDNEVDGDDLQFNNGDNNKNNNKNITSNTTILTTTKVNG